jgi:hypothetical protein
MKKESKIIPLTSSTYQEEINETINYLKEVEETLIGRLVNLAMAGKWKKWSDEQITGSTVEITEEMMRNTGDSNIEQIIPLIDLTVKIKNELK